MINQSFASEIFPSNMKMSRIIPIYKKRLKEKCSNYRPICLHSNIDKILEDLKRLLKKNLADLRNLLEKWSSFIHSNVASDRRHSTSYTVIHSRDIIRNKIDKEKYTCKKPTDFQKTFDTVDYHILLKS